MPTVKNMRRQKRLIFARVWLFMTALSTLKVTSSTASTSTASNARPPSRAVTSTSTAAVIASAGP